MDINAEITGRAFRNAELLVISEEEAALRDFFKPFFYEVSSVCTKPEAIVYKKKMDVKTASETQALYLWSAEPAGEEVKKSLKQGVVLIEGIDMKKEYVSRYLSSCSI